jgi:uncharacterized protein (DUF1778 family)
MSKTTVTISSESHQRAKLAATLEKESLDEFVSKAVDQRADPVLKKHNVRLPKRNMPVSQAA